MPDNSPKFIRYRSMVRTAMGSGASDSDALRQIYDKPAGTVSGTSEVTHAATGWSIAAEREWLLAGKPYFKVWPAMVTMLRETRFNFDIRYLQFPFEAFEVLLPTSEQFHTLMFLRGRNAEGNQTLFLGSYEKGVDRWMFELNEEGVVESGIKRIESGQITQKPSIGPNTPEVPRLLRICLAVAMFGTNQHELVAPDIEQETLLRMYPGGRSKASQRLAQEKRDREIAKCKGWRVGSEIDLPRPEIIRRGQPEKRGGELTAGHVRSGHMRMQPCGPRNQDRKLIFVHPCLVRPDLETRTTRGYRIRTKSERLAKDTECPNMTSTK